MALCFIYFCRNLQEVVVKPWSLESISYLFFVEEVVSKKYGMVCAFL